jgi:hypothetical protein
LYCSQNIIPHLRYVYTNTLLILLASEIKNPRLKKKIFYFSSRFGAMWLREIWLGRMSFGEIWYGSCNTEKCDSWNKVSGRCVFGEMVYAEMICGEIWLGQMVHGEMKIRGVVRLPKNISQLGYVYTLLILLARKSKIEKLMTKNKIFKKILLLAASSMRYSYRQSLGEGCFLGTVQLPVF